MDVALAGGIAGLLSESLTYPISTIKARQQLVSQANANSGVGRDLLRIVQNEVLFRACTNIYFKRFRVFVNYILVLEQFSLAQLLLEGHTSLDTKSQNQLLVITLRYLQFSKGLQLFSGSLFSWDGCPVIWVSFMGSSRRHKGFSS